MQGIKITVEEVEELRQKWFDTYPETKLHMNPTKMSPAEIARYAAIPYRKNEEEEEYDEEANNLAKKRIYTAVNFMGRKRNCCSFTSALNYVFQATVADGAKIAMWNLHKLGINRYLIGFVHDEFDYMLPANRVRDVVPKVEQAMISGMKQTIPDVVVKVETTINKHWDKSGVDYTKAEYDESGNIIVPDVPLMSHLDDPSYMGE